MFATLAKFWLFLSTLITALTRSASAIDHLAESAELQAEHFKLSKSEENRQSLEALRAQAKQPVPDTTSTEPKPKRKPKAKAIKALAKPKPSTSDEPFEL